MTSAGAILLAVAGLLLVSPREAAVRHRLHRVLTPRASPARVTRRVSAPWVAGVLAAAAVMVVLDGAVGYVVGPVAGAAAYRVVGRVEPSAARLRREGRLAELPAVLDLLAVCLQAGVPLVGAMEIVSAALPGWLAEDLATMARLQRLGASAAAAWSDCSTDAVIAPVAAAVLRSADSGSRLAAAFDRVAQDCRASAEAGGETRARRAEVLVMAPLGLCFLPAFLCLGVVPVVLAIASAVLH